MIGRQEPITVEAKDSGTDRVIITVTDKWCDRPDRWEAILHLTSTTKADVGQASLAVVQKHHRTAWRRD